jgi:hypothetical protein
MLIHPTVERLRALGLAAMADAFIELHNGGDRSRDRCSALRRAAIAACEIGDLRPSCAGLAVAGLPNSTHAGRQRRSSENPPQGKEGMAMTRRAGTWG